MKKSHFLNMENVNNIVNQGIASLATKTLNAYDEFVNLNKFETKDIEYEYDFFKLNINQVLANNDPQVKSQNEVVDNNPNSKILNDKYFLLQQNLNNIVALTEIKITSLLESENSASYKGLISAVDKFRKILASANDIEDVNFLNCYRHGESYIQQLDAINSMTKKNDPVVNAYQLLVLADAFKSMVVAEKKEVNQMGIGVAEYVRKNPNKFYEIANSQDFHIEAELKLNDMKYQN